MKSFLKRLAALALVLGVLGAAVLVSGIVPVRASSGHWAITKWFLDFASNRSISTHSAGIEVPPLDEPGMVRLGAGIYQSNCQWCHGSPVSKHPRVAAKMTPTPPYLPNILQNWEPKHEFYIVKHGIKFAGMPAWPTQMRDNEIWPLVAFLNEFHRMTAERYQELVLVEANLSAPEVVIESCAGCHGSKGEGIGSPRVPLLAGQNELYLRESLKAYANGNRHSGIMEPIAARLNDDEIAVAAQWYAKQEPIALQDPNIDTEAIEAGEKLISQADKTLKVPACSECHGEANDPSYPRLAGQPLRYLDQQLKLFRERRRGGTKAANLMHPIADALNDQKSLQIASYFAAQEPTVQKKVGHADQ